MNLDIIWDRRILMTVHGMGITLVLITVVAMQVIHQAIVILIHLTLQLVVQ